MFWTIGAASKELGEDPVTLRYWEGYFNLHIKRSKSKQRRYNKNTMSQLKEIIRLVRVEKYSLPGAKFKFRVGSE